MGGGVGEEWRGYGLENEKTLRKMRAITFSQASRDVGDCSDVED